MEMTEIPSAPRTAKTTAIMSSAKKPTATPVLCLDDQSVHEKIRIEITEIESMLVDFWIRFGSSQTILIRRMPQFKSDTINH
ncbi:hypothetical protein IE4872_CH00912 [Rhizobium gallicum]|uniref:Uncharacterized protein n=1 Tax=Rhizobium gallicum TaxID=56730 RepID=A0A1L5NF99_9HYPH|nr:hypothetical protein IE4872_CH00912 [Rhizobium gallicum]